MADPDSTNSPNPNGSPAPSGSIESNEGAGTSLKITLAFILPLFLHLLLGGLFTPDVAASYEGDGFEGSELPAMTGETWTYIAMLGLQIVVATGLIVYFHKIYLKHFPLRLHPLSILVGIIGVVLWIAVCHPQIEAKLLTQFGFDMSRPAFNPFLIQDDFVRFLFLGVRFSILCLIVPVVEELFVRGFLVRWYENPDFKDVRLTGLSLGALMMASVYGVVAHPMEAVAAFLWFGLVTLLMKRTGNLWDCVVAHAVTNFLLGAYVLYSNNWHLW